MMLLLLIFSGFLSAQSAADYFNDSAFSYINSQNDDALTKVDEGLKKYPSDKKLQELKKKIQEQKDYDSQKGDNQDKSSQDQNSKQDPEENDSPQKSGQQDGRNEGQEGSGSSNEDPLNAEGKENAQNNRDQGQRLQQQRYDQILKAIENQEQSTQRRLMMGKTKSQLGRKQKDW